MLHLNHRERVCTGKRVKDCFDKLLMRLTAAVRSTSFLLLRMKQASASSILEIDRETNREKHRQAGSRVGNCEEDIHPNVKLFTEINALKKSQAGMSVNAL